ncbi:hypothetical protein BDR03DRAFT_1018959 [Suillus americanus]|nr:hypothetical protein BDR03DRAFT_1018959 [Suillus americanus]
MPQKPRTSAQDDRSTFKSHAGQVMMREKSKGGGSVASSRSRTSSARSKPTSSSQSSSPTAQTSLSTKPASAVLKRLMMEEKEHNLLHEEHANERADAAAVHQRFKEHKETEICLREADATALALEADMLRLQIEWAKLNNKPA